MSHGSDDNEHIPQEPPPKSLTYGDYLKIPELLSLQVARSEPEEHDELLFIVIHQVYELWFKLVLHECEKIRRDLDEDRLFDALSTLRRVREVMKTMVSQIDILETMTPLEFSSFRERLDMASGFQSAQFRELEFLLGHKRPTLLRFHKEGTPAREQLQRRLDEPSVTQALFRFLDRRGLRVPRSLTEGEEEVPEEERQTLQDELVAAYKGQHDLVLLLEAVTDLDEGIQEWRYRHVKMVERTIGTKMGTGGSSGVDYLRHTLFRPLFPDLWTIRSRF